MHDKEKRCEASVDNRRTTQTISFKIIVASFLVSIALGTRHWFSTRGDKPNLYSKGTYHSVNSPYNTFDGEGFPACHSVSKVYTPSTVNEIASLVKAASSKGIPVRASGNGHMWYDTMCSDDPRTVIIKTEAVNDISDLRMDWDNGIGSVVVEAGATFPQIAQWLHERGAALGYTLVNWNITIGGAIAMGAHRSSLREDSQVSSAAVAMDIIDGKGNLVHLEKDQSKDTWLSASTSLGLLGIIARVKLSVLADYKVYANQITLEEDDVLNSDMFEEISPYVTANYWWWPGLKKFHLRTYNVVEFDHPGDAFQSTFSVTPAEGHAAFRLLNAGVTFSWPNFVAEKIFYRIWNDPNFHSKSTNLPLRTWPVYGYAYDVLIGGLYPDQLPEWEYDLHGKTLELAVPLNYANALLKRVRVLLDEAAANGKPVTATYRSGINIKFGKAFDSFLGQTTQRSNNATADWSKGAMMFDFPTFAPSTGDHRRYNEEWYMTLATTLINEFPVRPHWTKNTREVFKQSLKHIDQDSLTRFAKVRKEFDPDGHH
ncbi:hypothetical protein BDP27DRAFT_1335287 [Rhodocollybia butyracea]|uniref:D-arabinono-1,4-lactone oxidase n=1 Tax=Rhodocollybia butyracea TaxID=206335 RepID=A0A9P5U1W7_9AGAR|nr:hypothetical protein BDP27DRAFT_1335287 [Rhodocollybia butyracea]